MENENCQKCKEAFGMTDALKTAMELPCEHEICANCFLIAEGSE